MPRPRSQPDAPRQPLTLRFVGRRRELSQLEAALDGAAGGRGAAVLVSGDAGIGKTRMLEELERRAVERGFCAHWGRCHDEVGAPAFWPWLQTLRSHCEHADVAELGSALGPHADVLADAVPALRRPGRIRTRPTPLVGAEARFRMLASVTAFLRAAAASRPCLAVLDDLQWADPSSLQLLTFAVKELRDARVVIAATLRDVEIAPESEAARSLQSLRSHRIALAGLEEDDVQRLLAQLVGRRATPPWVRSLLAATGGNPFFLDRLARALALEGGAELGGPGDTPLPEEVRQLILDSLERLGEAARRTLSVAAALGHEFDAATLREVLDVPLDVVSAQLESAASARLIHESVGPVRHRFAHALVRETALGLLGALERARWHARIAEHLELRRAAENDALLPLLAHHFREAAPLVGVSKAVAYLRESAASAASLHAYEESVRRLELALPLLESEGVPEAVRIDVRLDLGEAKRSAGELAGARETFREAAREARRGDDPQRFARAALGFAGFWATLGVVDPEIENLLCEAVERVGAGEPALRSRLLARLALERTLGGEPALRARVEPAREALALARKTGDAAVLALGQYAWILAAEDEGPADRAAWWDETTRLAEEGGDIELALASHGWKAAERLAESDLEGFDACVAAHARLGQRAGHWTYVLSQLTWRATRQVLRGRFAEAEQSVAEMANRFGASASAAYGSAAVVLTRWHQGRLREVIPLLRGFLASLPGLRIVPFWLAWAEAEVDEPGAGATFAPLAARGFDDVRRDVFHPASLTLAAWACARLADRAAAERLYELLLPLAGRRVVNAGSTADFGAADRSLGLLAAVLGRMDLAASHLEVAIRSDEKVGSGPMRAWNAADLARVLRQRGAAGDAERASSLADTARAEALRLDIAGPLARLDSLRGFGERRRALAAAQAQLRREADHWQIACEGRLARLEDLRGLHYLRALLHRAGEPLSVLELLSAAGEEAGAADSAAEERARLNVTRALRLAIRKIGEVEPLLRRDLEANLKTGRTCRYEPDPQHPVRWLL
jgi:hypothetical protein